jgi:hypothetical protein
LGLFNTFLPPDEESQANVLSNKAQQKVTAVKPKIEVAMLCVDRNRWALVTFMLVFIVFLCALGWYRASERYANHVRVAFVKLDPAGSYNVAFDEQGSKPTFFINTVNSLLSTYVERRYSKVPYTIGADYGYVLTFMSPALKNSFLDEYQAAKVAASFSNCKTCPTIKVAVRTMQHDESDDAILNGKLGTVYRSTVFAEATELNPDGNLISKTNQIITLTWTLRDVVSLPDNLEAIQANPIGIEILDDPLKSDPTPITN